jgi:hypothetical protein
MQPANRLARGISAGAALAEPPEEGHRDPEETEMTRALTLALAVAALSLAAGTTADAQYLNRHGPRLSLGKDDLALMKAAARSGLDGKPAGTVVPWSNPASGNSGQVTLIKNLQRKGRDCRENRYSVTLKSSPKPSSYVLTICKEPDGSWKP